MSKLSQIIKNLNLSKSPFLICLNYIKLNIKIHKRLENTSRSFLSKLLSLKMAFLLHAGKRSPILKKNQLILSVLRDCVID